jgi:2-keto-4-pentenoate hydratase
MLNDAQRTEAAAALYLAEVERTPIPLISTTYPGADVVDAYAIATLVSEHRLAAGRIVKGHKVGLTSKAMREMSQAKEPDFGTLFDHWFVPEGSVIPADSLFRPLVEIEIAFVMREALRGPSVNAADVIRATDFVLPSIEIVDSRFTDRVTLVDTIADVASCGLVVLGGNPRRLTDLDIRRIGGTLWRNGEIEETGTAAAVMGNPINAVAWLANKLHEFGVTIEPGHVVLSGSFVRAVRMNPGDVIHAAFDEFGDVSIALR